MLVSQADVEARLGRSLSTEEATAFTAINNSIEAYVKKIIGSGLETATETTRYYDGGNQFLKIDPCTDITSVGLYDDDQSLVETFDTSDYVKEPINQTLKTMITSRYGKLYDGFANIGVTAKFSIADDTEIVSMVKNNMIDALVSEIDNSDQIIKESIEGYSIEKAKPESKSTLDKIKYLFPEVM